MNIRPYRESDLTAIQRLHANSGFDYPLPSMDDFFSKQVVDADGPTMAVLMKKTAELYLLCDPEWRTPAWRMQAINQLTEACRRDALNDDVKEAGAFLPPEVARTFGRRLIRMGWSPVRSDWEYYWRRV